MGISNVAATAAVGTSDKQAATTEFVGRNRLSSYKWSAFNPGDLIATATNALNTAEDSTVSLYNTQTTNSATETITFLVAGTYKVTCANQTIHTAAFTFERTIMTLGGTATRKVGTAPTWSAGDSMNHSESFSFIVTATEGQTLTVLPTYELTGSGAPVNHVCCPSVITEYCGI